MELTAATAEIYVRLAGRQMLDVVDRLGDRLVNERPPGPNPNSVAALVVHSCGVGEFWLGCVGLGRSSSRDRDAELVAVASVAELHRLLDTTLDQISADLRALDAGGASDANRGIRSTLEEADESDAALVVHVIEELFQHLGQMEITADALLTPS